jgi:hypothetical protein
LVWSEFFRCRRKPFSCIILTQDEPRLKVDRNSDD